MTAANLHCCSSLLRRRERVLALTLTGANLATVVAASVLTTFLHQFGPNTSYLAPFILAPLTLLIGESLPKLLTFRHPISFARIAARPLRALEAAFWPLLEAETVISRWLRKTAGVPAGTQSVFITREDLALMIRSLGDQPHQPIDDAILPAERQMISRIFRFKNADARQAMVPLVRVEAVALETTLAEAAEIARRTGFSRIPVFDKRIVNIVGLLHVFDLLEAPDLGRPVKEVMRQVTYFAESTPLDQILLTFQRTGQNLAVIVDEYGGAAGILTLEDLTRGNRGRNRRGARPGRGIGAGDKCARAQSVGTSAGGRTQRALPAQAAGKRRVCYHRWARGRTSRSYSPARRTAQGRRSDAHGGTRRRARGTRDPDHSDAAAYRGAGTPAMTPERLR